MQSTRSIASNMLRMQPAAAMLRTRAAPMVRNQATRGFRTSGLRMAKAPAEEQRAHTISQRIRTLKKIPPELIPLGIVLAAAIIAAVYSLGRKLAVDKTLRLYRQGPQKDH